MGRFINLYLFGSSLAFVASVCRASTYARIGFTEDMALSMAVANSMANGAEILVGPPSHTGGRHLGPIGYYWVYWASRFGGDVFSTAAVLTILEAAAILACALFVARLVQPTTRASAAATVLLCGAAAYAGLLSYPGHNHFLLVLTAIFLWAVHQAWEGGRAGAAFVALTASLLVQFHYSALPFVGVLALSLLWHRRRKLWASLELSQPISLGVIALTGLTWLPLLVYQFRYPQTFESTFAPHTSAATVHAGFSAACGVFISFFKSFALGPRLLPIEWPQILRTGTVVLLLSSLTALLFQAVFRLERGRRNFVLALILGAASYLPALAWLPAPLFPTYVYTLLPLPLIFVGLAVSSAGNLAASAKSRVTRIASSSVLCLWLAFAGWQAAVGIMRTEFRPVWHSLRHANEVVALIDRDRAGQPIELLPPQGESHFMRGPFLYLLGTGYHPAIEFWDWMPELESVPKVENAKIAYLVSCPTILKRDLANFEERYRVMGWLPEGDLSTHGCSTCQKCLIRRYVREPRHETPESAA